MAHAQQTIRRCGRGGARADGAGPPPLALTSLYRTVLALALFGAAAELPAALAGYRATLLAFAGRSMHERLEPAAVAAALERLLAPERRPVSVSWLRTHPPRSGRGHLGCSGCARAA